jgi:hypothetical protein
MPMENVAALRAELKHLRAMVHVTVDPRLLGELHAMITELERRLRQAENGGGNAGQDPAAFP